MRLIRRFVAFVTRFVLWLRYDIRITGGERLENRSGVLILANHPGALDPAILMSHLWNRLQPHPIAVEDVYYLPSIHWLMRLIRTIPMPNMHGGIGSYKRLKVRRALDHAASRLDQGQNILIYPAGRLMHSNREDLRGASGAFDILSRVQEKKVLLVRTRGIIGSSFSWVAWQDNPPLDENLLQGLKYILMNLIYFAPRRKVEIDLVEAPDDFPYDGGKMEINRYLDAWYNEGDDEEVVLVPLTFWSNKTFELRKPPVFDPAGVDIPPQIREQVLDELAKRGDRDASEIRDTWQLANELGFDSLELAGIVAWLQEEFHAFDTKPEDLRTVHDVQISAAGATNGADGAAKAPAPKDWNETTRGVAVQEPDTELSVHMNFLKLCERGGKSVALADEAGGVISYKRAKIGVLILADIIREYPEKNIGIMLPASGGAALVIMATLLAGKVPVMINWTVGDASIAEVIRVGEVNVILTSERFLERLDSIDFEQIADYVVTLESVRRKKINLRRKLRAVLRARKRAEAVCRDFGSHETSPDDTTVILFTSGSETAPKGVPLSHHNVLSNIASCLDVVKPGSNDTLYGFLPPFHSFGFTVTTLLPLTTGVKVAYYPNPTDARALAHGISMWQPTIVCGTPTFISGVFRSSTDAQLSSLRLVMTAGEKTPPELVETARKRFDAVLLEGYGITECSPVLTLCRPDQEAVGVGPAIRGVDLRMVHSETRESVSIGEQGLILASGPNVFAGYVGRDSSDAFMTIENQRYYITGDLGVLDANGSLILTGRLKRFVKMGGEMISLPAMESVIHKNLADISDDITSALTYIEEAGERPVICLFTTTKAEVDTINGYLRDAGLSNLARVRKVIVLEAMPLLGTGKTNYRELTKRLQASFG